MGEHKTEQRGCLSWLPMHEDFWVWVGRGQAFVLLRVLLLHSDSVLLGREPQEQCLKLIKFKFYFLSLIKSLHRSPEKGKGQRKVLPPAVEEFARPRVKGRKALPKLKQNFPFRCAPTAVLMGQIYTAL